MKVALILIFTLLLGITMFSVYNLVDHFNEDHKGEEIPIVPDQLKLGGDNSLIKISDKLKLNREAS